jgi:hypothetical protein
LQIDASGEVASSGFVPQDSPNDIENEAVDLSQPATLLTSFSFVAPWQLAVIQELTYLGELPSARLVPRLDTRISEPICE